MKIEFALKEMEVSNLKAQNKDCAKDLKCSCEELSNAQMDKAALKAALSSKKKHVVNYERFQIERNALKVERDVDFIGLDFTSKKNYIQFC